MGERLLLPSLGRASDAAYLAAADVAAIATDLDVDYRLVGGNAVSLLVAAHGLGDSVPGRETGHADFGAHFDVVGDPRLPTELRARGYAQEAGNRFARHCDVDGSQLRLVIDVLAPSYQSRLVTDQPHGDLVVDEVPGLAVALARPGVVVSARVRMTTGRELDLDLVLPDVQSMLCMKALAYQGRLSERDAVDIWRLLEVAVVTGVDPTAWAGAGAKADAAAVLRQHFLTTASSGPRRASARRADQARIRALVSRVVGR